MGFQPVTIAVIGAHALARRFQHGFQNSDEAILHDLRALASAAPAFLAGGVATSAFRLATAVGTVKA
jgi:hypothetical protein